MMKMEWQKSMNWKHIRRRIPEAGWTIARFLLIVGIGFMILYPLFVRFLASFKTYDDIYDPTVIFVPKYGTLDNYRVVMDALNYPVTLIRTILITFAVSALQVASCTLVAYGLARFRFFGSKAIYSGVLITLVIPTQVILLPLYIRFRYFNPLELFKFSGELSGPSLINTLLPILMLSVTAVAFRNGLYILLLCQFFRNQPKVLEEAADIDGCGIFRTFWQIMLPGAIPMLVTVFLFAFVWQWNDYYYTTILSPDLEVLSMQLLGLKFDSIGSVTGDMYAAVFNSPKLLLLIVPLLILYIFTQRFFTESIERSGIVG